MTDGGFKHLHQDPGIWAGAWVVKGTRVPVFILRGYFAVAGQEETLSAYPGVSEDALAEALAAHLSYFESDVERHESAWQELHDEAHANVARFRAALQRIADADLRRASAGWLQGIAKEALK